MTERTERQPTIMCAARQYDDPDTRLSSIWNHELKALTETAPEILSNPAKGQFKLLEEDLSQLGVEIPQHYTVASFLQLVTLSAVDQIMPSFGSKLSANLLQPPKKDDVIFVLDDTYKVISPGQRDVEPSYSKLWTVVRAGKLEYWLLVDMPHPIWQHPTYKAGHEPGYPATLQVELIGQGKPIPIAIKGKAKLTVEDYIGTNFGKEFVKTLAVRLQAK